MAVLPFLFARSHEATYRHFTIMAASACIHVMIVLVALALAFLADVPILAVAFFLFATVLLAVAIWQAWNASADTRSG